MPLCRQVKLDKVISFVAQGRGAWMKDELCEQKEPPQSFSISRHKCVNWC